MKCRLLECEIANHQKTLDVYRTDYDQLKEMIETEELTTNYSSSTSS
ncbi:hypothetical protein PPL_04737 [Heterostelium album PN500]|uniref:Uncharacterized protein n=1 Tax=Heterostelium pallidum (strain ATCC 26659 / Pp 5 / PN500) TaxID=670386 RepID=D3B8E4_HETP5|nr:hypothetical protein PPL_04737 [Heterostelium album PN500]EFA82312.1 hypothetical protein PPL_04737 [Heterostelium album PN500]|eukprot:XP_020434429.1 hypothetical protein PPL_04737 [Heterostelium album PN500]